MRNFRHELGRRVDARLHAGLDVGCHGHEVCATVGPCPDHRADQVMYFRGTAEEEKMQNH